VRGGFPVAWKNGLNILRTLIDKQACAARKTRPQSISHPASESKRFRNLLDGAKLGMNGCFLSGIAAISAAGVVSA